VNCLPIDRNACIFDPGRFPVYPCAVGENTELKSKVKTEYNFLYPVINPDILMKVKKAIVKITTADVNTNDRPF
jgi:hypothetical protein